MGRRQVLIPRSSGNEGTERSDEVGASRAAELARGYELVETAPAVADYLRLRAESGLSPKRAEQAIPAIANAWFAVHVRHRESGETVAMGRIVGDGGWYFQIADMATLPDHQHRGLGRAVLTTLLRRIHDHAPPDAYITLLADPPGVALYTSLGFEPTPSLGMWWRP